MEDTHWEGHKSMKDYLTDVLILVLMEDTHWEKLKFRHLMVLTVLILVLMEDTHWEIVTSRTVTLNCLNPCFNGRYSLRFNTFLICELNKDCLNPCFNGRYSLSRWRYQRHWRISVLILVLMEDTHWGSWRCGSWRGWGLNPCFNGRYSLRW